MRLVIIGAGFAGMYAALSAARLRDIQGVSPADFEIALVSPEPTLVVRPRLYEPKPETLTAPLLDVFKAIDVVYVQGSTETVDTESRTVQIAARTGTCKSLSYDRLVVACGSRLFRPNIPGLRSTASASTRSTMRLPSTSICTALPSVPHRTGATPSSSWVAVSPASRPQPKCRHGCAKSSARTPTCASSSSTATVCRARHGYRSASGTLKRRLRELGIETRLGVAMPRSTTSGLTLSSGEHIESETVIWSAGLRAAPLTEQIPAERDHHGRLHRRARSARAGCPGRLRDRRYRPAPRATTRATSR